MPKKPFIKKLYQFIIISILIIYESGNSKVFSQWGGVELVPGTTSCYIGKNAITATFRFFGSNCEYEVPFLQQYKISEITCLKGTRYNCDTRLLASPAAEVYFPIENSGTDWKFRLQGVRDDSPDQSYPNLRQCLDAVTQKVYSVKVDRFFNDSNACKIAEMRDPITTSNCTYAFNKDATDIVLKNSNSCNFGKDIYSSGINLMKSCFYQNARVTVPWISNRVFLCAGEGEDRRYSQDQATSKWISCSNTGTNVSDIVSQNFTYVPTFSYLTEKITYGINISPTSNFTQRGCSVCRDKNNDGRIHIQDCEGYVPEPVSLCRVSSDAACTFGTLGTNSNCAKSLANQNRSIDTANNVVYFCGSDNKTVKCDIGKKDFTYEQVFQNVVENGVRVYNAPVSGCSRVIPNNNENCKLKTTDALVKTCTFGPLINDREAASSTNYENCDELSSGEGYAVQFDKHVYCSPKNKKVTCDKETTYQALFDPEVPAATGQRDYTNKQNIVNSHLNAPYNCKEDIPADTGGCNVTADRSIFTCGVPSTCFTKDTPVPFERPYNSDILKGALYCFHDEVTDPRKGIKYWCPTENRAIVKYPRPSEVLSSSGSNFVVKTAWGTANCIKFAEIANECDKSGEYFDTVAGKKRCQCSPQFNPGYDPLLCGITGAIPLPSCEPRCKLMDVNEQGLAPVEIDSPLALIKVAAGFLFWAAVLLFIINFISSGIEYIQHSDEPDKVKDATTRLTNTLFGFIFLLVSAGVINYLLTLFLQIVVPK